MAGADRSFAMDRLIDFISESGLLIKIDRNGVIECRVDGKVVIMSVADIRDVRPLDDAIWTIISDCYEHEECVRLLEKYGYEHGY